MIRTWLLTINRVHLFVQPGAVEQAVAAGVEEKACGSLGFVFKSRILDAASDGRPIHVSVCLNGRAEKQPWSCKMLQMH